MATYLLHNSHKHDMSVISLRLDFQRHRAENVFGSLISGDTEQKMSSET